MPRTLLTSETSEKIRELQPMVEALNALNQAQHIVADHMIKKGIDEHDERLRDTIVHDAEPALLVVMREVCADYNLELRFNRTSGCFVLLDIP